jgi:hypothetical protein
MLDEPLGLTVHSLPRPQDALDADSRRTRLGRLKMVLLLLACAAPVVVSYLSYYVFRPQAVSSYGELVAQRPVPPLTATSPDGTSVSLSSLKGQWLLVSVAGGACGPHCEKHLYLQRQLRESLGKERERVDWVWLVSDREPVRPALLPALGQATVLRVDGGELARWLAPAPGQRLEDHLYVVDPMGHWMMRFPAELDVASAMKAKRDLDRVLRASAGWDRPGREAPRP